MTRKRTYAIVIGHSSGTTAKTAVTASASASADAHSSTASVSSRRRRGSTRGAQCTMFSVL
jgi:hypothetical protein